MRLRAPAVVASALLVMGLVGVSSAEATQSKAITSDFRCTQTLYGVDYEPGGPTAATLTLTAGDAPVGSPMSLQATFAATAGGVPNGPAALTAISATSVLEYTLNGVPRTAQSASQAVASVPAFGTIPVSTPSDPAVPLTGLTVNQAADILPTAFVVNFTSATAPFSGSVRCVPVKPTTPAAPTGWFEASPFSIASGTGLSVVVTGVPGPSRDRCEITNDASPPCSTSQDVQVSITAGKLTQRAYVDSTASTGSGLNGTVTGLSNTSATQINLGTITSPLAPTPINGRMNPITVTDYRGGVLGWSLTATMSTPLTNAALDAIPGSRLAASPTCAAATNATAYGYYLTTNDPAGTPIAGFDDTLIAPGVTAGAASQTLGGTVNLCTKDTQVNAGTDSTGGVYTVTAPLVLTVPAFTKTGTYNGVITVTLV